MMRALGILTGIGALVLSVSVRAQTADPYIAEIKAVTLAASQGRSCKWLLPVDDIAVKGKLADSVARLSLQGGVAVATTANEAAKATAAADLCGGPADQQKKTQIMTVRLEWLAKADALYTVSEASPYGKELTTLGASQAVRTQLYDRLKAGFISGSGAAQWNQFYSGIIDEARTTVALGCAERVNTRVKAPRACPIIPDNAKKYVPIARAQLKSVEDFGAALANAAAANVAAAAVVASNASMPSWDGQDAYAISKHMEPKELIKCTDRECYPADGGLGHSGMSPNDFSNNVEFDPTANSSLNDHVRLYYVFRGCGLDKAHCKTLEFQVSYFLKKETPENITRWNASGSTCTAEQGAVFFILKRIVPLTAGTTQAQLEAVRSDMHACKARFDKF